MTDIVERIRLRHDLPGKLADEAADEIERLREEVKKWQTLVSQGIEIERKLREVLLSQGANRYWEGRWRDADAELRAKKACAPQQASTGGYEV